jgi:hypothetical protein
MIFDTEAGGLEVTRVRGTDGNKSAPSWQDYLDALKLEGARYKPASLRKALDDRERAGGNPRTSEKEGK